MAGVHLVAEAGLALFWGAEPFIAWHGRAPTPGAWSLTGHPPVPAERRGQGLCPRVQKWFYEKFGEYVEDFRFQPEESAVETEEPLSARRWASAAGAA